MFDIDVMVLFELCVLESSTLGNGLDCGVCFLSYC